MKPEQHWRPIYPLRDVIKTEFTQNKYNRIGEGTNRFHLGCGHITYAKASQGEPKKKRCRECYLKGL